MAAQIPPNERVETDPPSPQEKPRDNGPLWFGLILILVGSYFLMTTMGFIDNLRLPFDNWWAFFFLIPIIGSARTSWQAYKTAGDQVTSKVLGPLFGGLIFTVLFIIFFFKLDWSRVWPVFLVLLGIFILSQSVVEKSGD